MVLFNETENVLNFGWILHYSLIQWHEGSPFRDLAGIFVLNLGLLWSLSGAKWSRFRHSLHENTAVPVRMQWLWFFISTFCQVSYSIIICTSQDALNSLLLVKQKLRPVHYSQHGVFEQRAGRDNSARCNFVQESIWDKWRFRQFWRKKQSEQQCA